MWFERFVIIVTSLHRDYLPSSWTMFSPTFVDIGIFIGTIGFFFVLFLLYARSFPVIAQAEVKTILKSSGEKYKRLRAEHGDHVDHYNPLVREPVANAEDGLVEREDPAEGPHHEETVNADGLMSLEIYKDRIDEMLGRIGIYDPATQTADDLQKITGIGPLVEQRLHQLGIYTYDQVSRLTVDDIELLDTIIDDFSLEGRHEEWTTQATKYKNKK